MSGVRVQSGAVEPVQVYVQDAAGDALPGLTDLYLRIRRDSDGKFLDWNDSTFKSAGWTTLDLPLTEADAALAPGIYEVPGGVDTGSWTNANPDDNYLVYPLQSPGTNARLPGPGELKVGQWVDRLDVDVSTRLAVGDSVATLTSGTATVGEVLNLLRQMITNRLEEQHGSPGLIRLYLDDGTSVRFTWQVRPETGNVIGEIMGSPARRGAAT